MIEERKPGVLVQDVEKKICLRTFRQDDANDLLRGWKDLAVQRSFREGAQNEQDLEDARAYIHFARGQGETMRDLVIESSGRFAGALSWRGQKDVFAGNTELSYWLLPEMRGKGLATVALQLSVDFLFFHKKCRCIWALTDETNMPSQRTLKAAGFEREAIIQQLLLIEGTVLDGILFGMRYDQWNERKTCEHPKKSKNSQE